MMSLCTFVIYVSSFTCTCVFVDWRCLVADPGERSGEDKEVYKH